MLDGQEKHIFDYQVVPASQGKKMSLKERMGWYRGMAGNVQKGKRRVVLVFLIS